MSWSRLGRVRVLAVTALSLPFLAACGGESDSKETGTAEKSTADGTGSLVVYSGRSEELIAPLLKDMEKATGAKVEVRYGDSAELAAQLLEEGDRTKADLFFSQDAGALGALGANGRLAELPQKSLDEVDQVFRAEDGTWVGVSGRARVIAYNADKVKDAPVSVDELTEPKWKGKVAYAPTNASFQAFVTGMRVMKGDDATRTWLKDFKANDPQVLEKNGAVLDAVDAGEAELGLINHYYWYEKAAEVGEDKLNAKLSFPTKGDPGALVNVAGVGILKGTDAGATAQKAVDFLLSQQAQTYFADETHEYPLAAGVAGNSELPALDSIGTPEIDLSKLESLDVTLEMLQEAGMV
ncbi:iron ABC transporter substrate-binding protein [Streptomyces sp. NPDC048290]|uniref:iron ABC transporter substrate-binding protein n=1 Tax=Streptomyces sp. NPDC048290 TaxID=3155811 RepID=UPI003420F2D7